MARFVPLLRGALIEATDLKAAEAEAFRLYGAAVERVESFLNLELDREARRIGNRRRRTPDEDA